MEPVEEVKSIEEVKPKEDVKPIEEVEPTEEVKSIEEVEPVEEVKSIEEVEPVEEVKSIEEVKPLEEMLPVMTSGDDTLEAVNEELKSEIGIADTQFDFPDKVTEIKPMEVPDVPATGLVLPEQPEQDPTLFANEEKQGEKEESLISNEQTQIVEETSKEALPEIPKEEPAKVNPEETKPKRSFWKCCSLRRKEEPPNSVMTPLLDPTNPTTH